MAGRYIPASSETVPDTPGPPGAMIVSSTSATAPDAARGQPMISTAAVITATRPIATARRLRVRNTRRIEAITRDRLSDGGDA